MDINTLISAKVFAVVGASADDHKVGHQILRNLASNKDLTVYPINLKGGTILDLPVYGHLSDTPKPPEIVVISVPAKFVEQVIDECVSIHVKAVILISAGFAEIGEDGKLLQSRIVAKLERANIALLGPNTMGYIAPLESIYASFGPGDITLGNIALISQSGAMLSALFQEYQSAGTGISLAFSLGNRTGLSENDILTYLENDPNTKLIVIYLESIADPKRLLSIAKRITPNKPIFLLKGGVTEQGRSAAVSHTASLATSQVLLDDLCLQAGIVQVRNFEQLVRASIAVAKSTFLPENVMVITNAGGPSVVLTDEISTLGIPLVSPPLDLLGDATANDYDVAITKYSRDLTVDAIVVIVTEQAVTDMDEITRVLGKPWGKHLLFACLAGGDQMEIYRTKLKEAGVIVTRYPNEIAETLNNIMQARRYLGKKIELTDIQVTSTNKYPETFKDLAELLKKYNLMSPEMEFVSSDSQLVQIERLGWPMIAKTTSLELKHKAKIGAVIGDIVNMNMAIEAYHKLTKWNQIVLFEQKIKNGTEVILGAHNDPFWGWYMAIGMGGSLSDTYDDRAYIFLPSTIKEMENALKRTKLAQLLDDTQTSILVNSMYSLQDCIFTTASLTEIEINPLFVMQNQVIVADLKRT